jgi:A/G-specific adenine glycosylase
MDIKKLELWYKQNHRKLVFRETKEPYYIWVSEIMLQQTQVDTVLPFFSRFINQFPTVYDLAKADEDMLHKAVEGLGYYRRFRYMHLAAKKIVNEFNGQFPNTYKEVLSLPGVGKYTAGAIMSIAYNKPFSALDGNVIRVLSRYLNIDDDMRVEKNRMKLDHVNQEIIMNATPYVYTQAMMELGATICKPKNPLCDKCPLQAHCEAYANDLQSKLPVLSKLKKQKELNYITLIIRDKENIYLYKRTEELLKNMYMYPQFESESIQQVLSDLESKDIVLEPVEHLGQYKHVFTHLIWHMNVYEVRVIHMSDDVPYEKYKYQDIQNLPMAIAHRKIKR